MRIRTASAAALVAVLLSGCGGGSDVPEPAAEPVVTSSAASASATADLPVQDAVPGSDVCALLADADVSAVVGTADVGASGTFGAIDDPGGGQCVWAAADTTQLEVVVWSPGGFNPPPDEAPAAGSVETVDIGNGRYGATAEHVYLVRVTGPGAADATTVDRVRALAPVVAAGL